MRETTNGQAAALWGGLSMSVTGLGTTYAAWTQIPVNRPGVWIGAALFTLGLVFAIAALISIYRHKRRDAATVSPVSIAIGEGDANITAGGNITVGGNIHIEHTRDSPKDGRVFISIAALELAKPFLSNLTSYQAKKLTSDYLDKWVRWAVKIYDISQLGETPQISVYLRRGPLHLPLYVNLWFLPSEKARIVHLKKGTTITVEGQIDEICMAEVRLKNCRLVEELRR